MRMPSHRELGKPVRGQRRCQNWNSMASFRARLLATLPQMPPASSPPSLLHLHTAPRDALLKLLFILATLLLKASNYSQKTTGKALAFKNFSNCTASHMSLCAHFWLNLSDVCADPRHQLPGTCKGGGGAPFEHPDIHRCLMSCTPIGGAPKIGDDAGNDTALHWQGFI